MATANEQDVVIAFRQAVEEEMRRAQSNTGPAVPLTGEGVSTEQTVQRLVERHLELEHEVALLRTIILRLISEPVDEPTEQLD
jgi:UDP-N-acetylmuramyl tripeptide synthase